MKFNKECCKKGEDNQEYKEKGRKKVRKQVIKVAKKTEHAYNWSV